MAAGAVGSGQGESEARRRVQAAEASLAELQSIAQRARLDLTIELSSKVDGNKLAVADAEEKVRAQQLEGEHDVAIVRQKRDKAAFDITDAERIIASLSMKSPATGQISLMPNYRNSGPGPDGAEFKRGDRAWFGAPIAEYPDLSTIRAA